MKRVGRHTIDLELSKRVFAINARVIDVAREAGRTKASALNALAGVALDLTALIIVTGGDFASACAHARLGAHALAALFAAATAKSLVECPLGEGPPARLAPTGPTDSTDADNWLVGFHAAGVTRDQASLDRLCSTPVDVLRSSSSRADECTYLLVEAYQALWHRDTTVGARFVAALAATEPSRVTIAPDFVLNVIVPEIAMFTAILSGGADLDARMTLALERHKKFWGRGDAKRNPRGFLCWPALSAASFAYDAEMAINVESDYLPKPFYRGDCRPAQASGSGGDSSEERRGHS